MKEKFNLINELRKKNEELVGKKKLSMVGQGDFPGKSALMRTTMNIKHHNQHLTIDKPEFPFIYNGNENLIGANSSFYYRTNKTYKVINIVKKYNELLKGKTYSALYFLYCKDDDSYRLIERKECEDLTEKFGFDYKNDYLDNSNIGDTIPTNTVLYTSTSYDDDMNVSIGVNGRILYAVDPYVQDDAIKISESFAKRMMSNKISTTTIPVNDNTVFINLYGDDNNYQCLPNIGDTVTNGILAATRTIKETRMFSDLRDISLTTINFSSDQIFYGDGEVIDINVYCNNHKLKPNNLNRQLFQYYNDAKVFYTEVYRICKKIINSGSKSIDREINHWMRKAMNYLDEDAKWAFNDNIFSNMMVEILIRRKEPIRIGRKITGRYGNKTVVSKIVPDEEMPYITVDSYVDEYGAVHPKGEKKRIELITNPLAFINRGIPMALFEASKTFILERVREYMATLDSINDKKKIMFDVIKIFNTKEAKDTEKLYNSMSEREQREFIKSAINKGIYIKVEPFDDDNMIRDAVIRIYKEFDDIVKPYNLFIPKPNWGRDIFVGKYHIGYQYILLLKQSGEKGFSVRSAGAISDESLPEKSNENKIGKLWHSETPIRFGEYETPNFMIITRPEDFALITALYRSSIDGRRFMYEAIISEDGEYNIPDKFTSRSAEILQVYLKSLGVKIESIHDEDEYIDDEIDDKEIIAYTVKNRVIFCTNNEMYHVKKLSKMYKRYIKDNPNMINDFDEVWDYVMENLPFKKKHLTDDIINIFKRNLEVLTI
jgi:hypothetical protein